MSRITGGIFSRPRGQTGGLVFGAARSREGKVVTIREKVIPSNPKTAEQMKQRGKFKSILKLIRTFGAAVYQSAWNRAVGQLAGFQSLMSVYLHQINADLDISLIFPINLGILHFPETVTFTAVEGNAITVDYSTELGVNGSESDVVVAIACAVKDADRNDQGGIVTYLVGERASDSFQLLNLLPSTEYQIYFYIIGSGTAKGLRSIANPYAITTL